MPETCDGAGCSKPATMVIVDSRGYELAVSCDDDAWRFETRTFPVGDMAAYEKAEQPPGFARWWELQEGIGATESFRRCAELAWGDAKTGRIGSAEGSGQWPGLT